MTTKLTIVPPLTITEGMFVYDSSLGDFGTNVDDDIYPEWTSGEAITMGDLRYFGLRRYEALTDLTGFANDTPPPNATSAWLDVGAINRLRVFDASVTSKTEQGELIRYAIEPGSAVNTVAILGVEFANTLRVSVFAPLVSMDTPEFTQEIDVGPQPATPDWWSWFFGGRFRKKQGIFFNLPVYPDMIVQIEIEGDTDMAVGEIIIGRQFAFGLGVELGARVGIQDYSRKEVDEFGNTVIVPRAFAKRASFDMYVPKGEVDPLINTLTQYRAMPVLYIGSATYESTIVYGFYKNFDLVISYPEHSEFNLELEGVT